jgi:hypothetical protein
MGAQMVATVWPAQGGKNGLSRQKTVATGCHRLLERQHGKEGVDGSSPSEGSAKAPNAGLSAQDHLLVVQPAVGMEAFVEPSGQKSRRETNVFRREPT